MKYKRFALVALLAVSFGVAATPKEGLNDSKWEKVKQRYINLLSSENPGVKASAANFIRRYNIVEATEALKEVLACENCELVKVSAALALVQVAGENGELAIKDALKTEQNELIISLYKAILHGESVKVSDPVSSN